MKRVLRILAVVLFVALAAIVVCDGVIALGGTQGWQYAYNAFFCLVCVPLFVYIISPKEIWIA